MNAMYTRQRANGDWFVLASREGFRVPIFSSNRDMLARAFNVELLFSKPVPVYNRAPTDRAGRWPTTHAFLLVKNACANMKQGVALEHSELARLIRVEKT